MTQDTTQFLKDYTTKRAATVSTPSTAQPKDATADQYLSDKTGNVPDPALVKKQKELHEKAKKIDAANLEKEKLQQEKDNQERIEQEKQAQLDKQTAIQDRVRNVSSSIGEHVQPIIDKAGTLPTLGGLGLPIAILLILIFVVIPVNAQGDTRAKQIWYMLMGQATLQGRQLVSKTVTPPSGTSGNFGSGPSIGNVVDMTSYRSTIDTGF